MVRDVAPDGAGRVYRGRFVCKDRNDIYPCGADSGTRELVVGLEEQLAK